MAVDEKVFKGIKILIVDDNQTNMYSLTALLESYAMQVDAVASGEAAIAAIPGKKYNIILMDIRMPGMNGYEAIKQIRFLEKTGAVPIIAVTAQAMVGDRNKCLEAGADDYISKPIDTDLLLEKMERLIRNNQ